MDRGAGGLVVAELEGGGMEEDEDAKKRLEELAEAVEEDAELPEAASATEGRYDDVSGKAIGGAGVFVGATEMHGTGMEEDEDAKQRQEKLFEVAVEEEVEGEKKAVAEKEQRDPPQRIWASTSVGHHAAAPPPPVFNAPPPRRPHHARPRPAPRTARSEPRVPPRSSVR